MWSCDQSLLTSYHNLNLTRIWPEKLLFFWGGGEGGRGGSWFRLNNLGRTIGATLKFYTSITKGLKLNVRKFWGLNPTFVEVIGEKLEGGGGHKVVAPQGSWFTYTCFLAGLLWTVTFAKNSRGLVELKIVPAWSFLVWTCLSMYVMQHLHYGPGLTQPL